MAFVTGRSILGTVLLAATVAACSSGDNTAATTTTADTTTNGASTSVTTQTTTTADGTAATTGAAMPAGVTADMIASGEKQFKGGVCIACHGADATGTAMAPNLTDSEWINIDGSYDAIKSTIKTGVPTPKSHPAAMPPMGGAQLTDQQIAEIAAYVYSISHMG
jgi:mono/diheme cytochrome c family protein